MGDHLRGESERIQSERKRHLSFKTAEPGDIPGNRFPQQFFVGGDSLREGAEHISVPYIVGNPRLVKIAEFKNTGITDDVEHLDRVLVTNPLRLNRDFVVCGEHRVVRKPGHVLGNRTRFFHTGGYNRKPYPLSFLDNLV